MNWKRRVFASLAAGLVITGGSALPANAWDQALNASCQGGEICFFWGPNQKGSFSDFYWSRPDFGGERFVSPGDGQGQRVKNNAASAINFDRVTARVYYNENFNGPYDDVTPGITVNLVNTRNDNASFRFLY